MRKAIAARPGASPWANAAGRSVPYGIVGGHSGSKPVSWRCQCGIPSIPSRLSGWWSAASLGRTPWYLLTAEPVTTDEDAWHVVFVYMRRWQIELTWRFNKSELAFESPRLWRRPEREKLLALATLAYAFLLHLLEPRYEPLRRWLLRHFCHRTGWHLRRVRAPLYRLRSAQRPLVATLSALLRGLGETTSNASAGDLHLTLVSGWSRSRPLCPCRTESETQDHLKAARLP